VLGVGTGIVLLVLNANRAVPPAVSSAAAPRIRVDVSGGTGRGDLVVHGAW
jgi:hypothetical protein